MPHRVIEKRWVLSVRKARADLKALRKNRSKKLGKHLTYLIQMDQVSVV